MEKGSRQQAEARGHRTGTKAGRTVKEATKEAPPHITEVRHMKGVHPLIARHPAAGLPEATEEGHQEVTAAAVPAEQGEDRKWRAGFNNSKV